MNIKIICVGKLKENYWKSSINEYLKRLRSYCKIEIVEIKESQKDDIEVEGKSIVDKICKEDYVISLAINGNALSSEGLAKKIEDLGKIGRSQLSFVIGGSEGLSKEVLERSNFSLSFSQLTFPHQMIRVFLLEQIYRSFKIIKNEPYHK